MSNQAIMANYLTERQANEKAPKTLELETIILKQLAASLNKPFKEATKEDVMSFFNHMQQKYKTGSIHTYKRRVKHFYNWLYQLEEKQYPESVKWIKSSNPTKRAGQEMPIKPEDLLIPGEVKALVNASNHPRDQALIMLLYETAARAEEALSLRVNSISFDSLGGRVTLQGRHGARIIRIVDSVPYLQAWLNVHPARQNPNAPLWIAKITGRPSSKVNENIGYDNLYRMLALLRKKTGITKEARPHLLRHARLTDLANHLTDSQLKTYAGWTPRSQMTGVYVHLAGKDLDEPILTMHGLKPIEKPKEAFENKLCVRGHVNQAEAVYCNVCGIILDEEKAHEVMERDKQIEVLETKVAKLKPLIEFMESHSSEELKTSLMEITSKKGSYKMKGVVVYEDTKAKQQS